MNDYGNEQWLAYFIETNFADFTPKQKFPYKILYFKHKTPIVKVLIIMYVVKWFVECFSKLNYFWSPFPPKFVIRLKSSNTCESNHWID